MAKHYNFVAVTGTTAEEKKYRLGDLFWYSVSEDCEIDRDDLSRILQESGIDMAFMPNEIRHCDAFKKATSALQEKRIAYLEDNSRFANFLIQDVITKGDVVRHLIQVIVDQENVQCGYQEVARFMFDSGTKDISYEFLPHEIEHEVLEDKIKSTVHLLTQLYPKYANSYGSRHIRDLIMNVLDSTNPAPVKPSGGLYFVPNFSDDILYKLEKMIKLLGDTGHGTIDCHTVELYNVEKHREMLAGKLTEQAIEKLSALELKLGEILCGDASIKQGVADIYYDQYRKLLVYTEEYERLLQVKLLQTRTQLDVIKEQIQEMFDRTEIRDLSKTVNA